MSAVLITGVSSGFGRLTTEALAARGHEVVAAIRDPAGRNAAARGELETLDGVRVVELDVNDEASVERGVAAAEGHTGGLDVAVNNAGIGMAGLLETMTSEQARQQFETNVFGPLRVNRAALPGMHERGAGLLVHVSSGLGRFVFPFVGLYAASKYALEAIAEAYRYELAPHGIDSVIVEPGVYATSLGDNSILGADPERGRAYGEWSDGAQRLFAGDTAGDPQEVADAIADLVELPHGERPLRVPVGVEVQGLHALNQATDAMAREMLTAVGMGALLPDRPQALR